MNALYADLAAVVLGVAIAFLIAAAVLFWSYRSPSEDEPCKTSDRCSK